MAGGDGGEGSWGQRKGREEVVMMEIIAGGGIIAILLALAGAGAGWVWVMWPRKGVMGK